METPSAECDRHQAAVCCCRRRTACNSLGRVRSASESTSPQRRGYAPLGGKPINALAILFLGMNPEWSCDCSRWAAGCAGRRTSADVSAAMRGGWLVASQGAVRCVKNSLHRVQLPCRSCTACQPAATKYSLDYVPCPTGIMKLEDLQFFLALLSAALVDSAE